MSASVAVGTSKSRVARRRGRIGGLDGTLKAGLALFAGALALGLAGALFMVDPNHQDLQNAFASPLSEGHLLGTDVLGRDVLSWTAHSVTTSLKIAIVSVALASILGTAVGVFAGYLSGPVDSLLMRTVDLVLSIPPLLLALSAAAALGGGQMSLILIFAFVNWVTYARLVRGKILIEKQRASIAAARLAGVGHGRIIARHLLPSVVTLVTVIASVQVGYVFLFEASLSFVGHGVQPPDTSLGFLIAQGRTTLAQAWWVVVFPGAMLALLLLAANLVGDGLRDRFGVDVEVVEK